MIIEVILITPAPQQNNCIRVLTISNFFLIDHNCLLFFEFQRLEWNLSFNLQHVTQAKEDIRVSSNCYLISSIFISQKNFVF